jgi:hypothetical protein
MQFGSDQAPPPAASLSGAGQQSREDGWQLARKKTKRRYAFRQLEPCKGVNVDAPDRSLLRRSSASEQAND